MKNLGKIFGLMLVSLFLILTITACGGAVDEPEDGNTGVENSVGDNNQENIDDSENKNEEKDSENEEKKDMDSMKYYTKEIDEDQALSDWVENNKFVAGEYQYPNNKDIYMIAAGEKNTGGYTLKIMEEELEANNLALTYTVKAPAPDEMVTQAITYPYLLIKIIEEVEEVIFIEE